MTPSTSLPNPNDNRALSRPLSRVLITMPWWISAFWLLALLLGLAALLLLYRSLFHDRSRGRRRCPSCWYDITPLKGLKCPECGRTAPSERSLLRTRRHYRRVLLALLALSLAWGAARVPRAAKSGNLWSALPFPILLLVVQVYDDAGEDLLAATPDPAKLSSWERMLLARACAVRIIRDAQGGVAAPSGAFFRQTAAGPPITRSMITAIPGAGTFTFTASVGGTTYTASTLLFVLGSDARPAAATFISALNSPNVFVRQTASQWLKWPAFRVPAAVAPLSRGCSDSDPQTRLNCIDALADTGPPAAAAFDSLCLALESNPDHIERIAIIVALRLIAPQRAVPVLIKSLEDEHRFVRASAAIGLGEIGPTASSAIDALKHAQSDPDHVVRSTANLALRAIARETP